MEDYNYSYISEDPNTKKFKIIPLLVLLGLQVVEAIVTIVCGTTIPDGYELFYSLTWFLGKFITLALVIVIYRVYFLYDLKRVGKNFKAFISFCIVGFVVFYVFSIGSSMYSMLMDHYLEIGEAANQEGIYEYFKSSNKISHYVLLFFTIVILAPLLEEFEFRKLVYDAFPNCHFIIPTIVSALLFGLAHMAEFAWSELLFLPVYCLPGFCLALLYHYSGNNIYVTFFSHMASNFLSFMVIITSLDSL